MRARTLSGLSSFLICSLGLSGSRYPSFHWPSARRLVGRGLRAGRSRLAVAAAAAAGPVVEGRHCAFGHLNAPVAAYCTRCGALVDRRLPLETGPRPPLGLLVADDGTAFVLENDMVIGRDPAAFVAQRAGRSLDGGLGALQVARHRHQHAQHEPAAQHDAPERERHDGRHRDLMRLRGGCVQRASEEELFGGARCDGQRHHDA